MKTDIAIGVIGAIVIIAFVFVASALSLGWNRVAQPYQKETDRLTYQNSVARQQGANNGIAQDCANMESNVGAQKLAFARFVLSDAAAYVGDRGLSKSSMACVRDAKVALSN